MLIALCLMFSLVPVAGSQDAADRARYNTMENLFSSIFIVPSHHVLPVQVSGRDSEAGTIIENGAQAHIPGSKAFTLGLSYSTQSHVAHRTLEALPKPAVDDLKTKRSDQGIGDAECDMQFGRAARHATQTRAVLADSKLHSAQNAIRSLLSYRYMKLKSWFQDVKDFAKRESDLKKDHSVVSQFGRAARHVTQTWAILADSKLHSAQNAIRSLLSYGYMKLKSWFQDVKEFAKRESDLKKDHSVVSHGLIKVKLLEVAEVEYPDLYKDKLKRKSEIHAGAATPHTRFPVKSPNLKSSHIGLGDTREKVQIRNVVATLRKSGLFAAIAGVIEGMNLFMLPQFVTIFTPTDSAYQTVQHADIDQLELFQYHTVVQRYAFSQLCTLREDTILYTMRPGYSILVTQRQSPFKISLDNVFVIAPDLYVDETIAVHGIDGIFNATLYGKNLGGHVPEVATPPTVHDAPSNVSDKLTPLASPPGQQSAGLNNGSTAEAGQQGGPVQPAANTDTDNTHTSSSNFPASPLASEIASDIDASCETVSARYGACYAAAYAFFCVLSFLCC